MDIRKKVFARSASLVLSVAFILSSAALLLVKADPLDNNSAYTRTVAEGLSDVTGQYDLSDVRSAYFNKDIVKDNPFHSNAKRWIIVALEGESIIDSYQASGSAVDFSDYAQAPAAKAREKALISKHNTFLSQLSKKGIEYEYKYSYTALNNGVAIKVKNKDVDKIERISGVQGVYYSESYAEPDIAVTNNANVYSTGIYDSSNVNYKGDGIVVAVLDTGLDHTHPAFSTMPSGGWRKQDVDAKLKNADISVKQLAPSVTVDEVYYNEKVPFAFDYADSDSVVFSSYSAHGTHVAGIVAGKDDTKIVNMATGEKFVGVAPNAQLAIMKVFTDDPDSSSLGGAENIDILAAVNDCAVIGVDVINMSLGMSCGFSNEESNSYSEQVYSKVEELGISLVASASNDASSGYGGGNGTNLASNPDSATVGSPSTYSAAISVASINGQKSKYMVANGTSGANEKVAFITEASDGNGNRLDFLKALYAAAGKTPGQELTLSYVVVGGSGNSANYTPAVKSALADGKTIALVRRGDINFSEKIQNAKNNGAIACIIYNHIAGTIQMSLGELDNPIPACSVSMDEGKMLTSGAVRNIGTLTFSYSFEAGPFISGFSSWGPTPDLKLKPEITAHGGEITSAIPGGYDVYSGTSMASPNLAGAIALLRQHVIEQQGLTGKALNARVNQLLMSTAEMALNEEGNPYSPRKQGAGLADIKDAMDTQSYISVKDSEGKETDKTKLELGDDKNRNGVYKMTFTVNNFSNRTAVYTPDIYVMTETMSSDNKTVAEKAYMITDRQIDMKVGGAPHNISSNIVVETGAKTEIEVTVTLNKPATDYLNANFKNGMFVEGFIKLRGAGETTVSLGVPYLAFYGDWNDAPLFDYSVYDIAASEQDTSVQPEDKIKASAAATTPYGLYDDNQYVLPLGTYLYNISPFDTEIYASDERAAISMYDIENRRSIYELYSISAGLLRGAKTMEVNISDNFTGQTVYNRMRYNIPKSYAAGGANRGSNFPLQINPNSWGFANNGSYTLTMNGTLDYPMGDSPNNSGFSFNYTVDYEAPFVSEYRIRFEPYTDNKVQKYRIYMDVDVFDNHFAQALLPCYANGSRLTPLTDYPVPVYSQRNSTTTVSFEVTNFYDDYVRAGRLYFAVQDYAMNESVYHVNALNAIEYPDSVSFATDNKLKFKNRVETASGGYDVYTLALAPNEIYKINMSSEPETIMTKLNWQQSNERVLIKDNEIFAVAKGSSGANLVMDNMIKAKIEITVDGNPLPEPIPERITFHPVLDGRGYFADLTGGEVNFYPNQGIQMSVDAEPWYSRNIQLEWSSSNTGVMTVDSSGYMITHKKGTAYLTVKATAGGRSITKTLRINVSSEFYISNFRLIYYYGGPEVVIPEELNVMYLDQDAFIGNTYITSVVLPSTLLEIETGAFANCTALRSVVIPSTCTIIEEGAFYGCTALETVTLLQYQDEVDESKFDTGTITVGKSAFENCINLKTITNSLRITAAFDYAFRNCTSLRSINIGGLRISGRGVFSSCTSLNTVETTADTVFGEYMFQSCTALQNFIYKGNRIAAGVFDGCSLLRTVTFTASEFYSVGDFAFSGTDLREINLPNGTYKLGAGAFFNCAKLAKVNLSPGTKLIKNTLAPFAGCAALTEFTATDSAYYSVSGGVLYSLDGKTVELVPHAMNTFAPGAGVTAIGDGALTGSQLVVLNLQASGITAIGAFAFAGSALQTVSLPDGMTEIPEGAFYGCTALSSVTFGSGLRQIGAYAFYGCKAFVTANLPGGTEKIGEYAFADSGVRYLSASGVTVIGAYAFSGTAITALTLESVRQIGDSAFYNNSDLVTVNIQSAVVSMGRNVFRRCGKLASASFGNGTMVIGAYAFYNISALNTVNLPASVESIGEYAFYNAVNMTTVGTTEGVRNIGAYAFYACAKIDGLNLEKTVTIGERAFANTAALTSLNLACAEEIGKEAFLASGLESVLIPAVKKIGAYAFADTSLVTVDITDSLNVVLYEDSWYQIRSNGRPELITGKLTASYGEGAFSGIETLTAINVSTSNPAFVSLDGVLYSKLKDGLRLEQYPAGKTGASYTVAENTVRIGDSAFEGCTLLQSVTIPYTVKSVGSYAFFDSSVKEYTFESVEAPVLESRYVDENEVTGTLKPLFGMSQNNYIGSRIFYANFSDYVALIIESKGLSTPVPGYTAPDFELTINYPQNGKGYGNLIWKSFFSTVNLTAYAAESVTRQAIEAIGLLPDADTIKAILSSGTAEEQKTAVRAISGGLVLNARKAYNLIADAGQRALVTGYAQLLSAEAAVREVKSALGISAQVSSLVMAARPAKINYVEGESFDTAGMIIKAVFDDMSEIIVTDYTLNKTVLSMEDESVTISYSGKQCVVKVSVTESGIPPVEPDEPTSWLVYLFIGLGAVVVCAGGVTAFVLIRRKKRSAV